MNKNEIINGINKLNEKINIINKIDSNLKNVGSECIGECVISFISGRYDMNDMDFYRNIIIESCTDKATDETIVKKSYEMKYIFDQSFFDELMRAIRNVCKSYKEKYNSEIDEMSLKLIGYRSELCLKKKQKKEQ